MWIDDDQSQQQQRSKQEDNICVSDDEISAANLYISEMRDTTEIMDDIRSYKNIGHMSESILNLSDYQPISPRDKFDEITEQMQSIEQTCSMVYDETALVLKNTVDTRETLQEIGLFMQRSDAIIQANLVENFRSLENKFMELSRKIDQVLEQNDRILCALNRSDGHEIKN